MTEQAFYIGIDIDDTYAVASFFTTGMKEPETFSMVTGSEVYQIPVKITKKKDTEQWVIGEEAQKQQEQAVDSLFSRALNQEEVLIQEEKYLAEELLLLYIRKLIGYAGGLHGVKALTGLVISVERLNTVNAELLQRIRQKLGVERSKFQMIDRKSAFYYFALRQQESLWLHDVCLYDYRGENLTCLCLKRHMNTKPQLVTVEEHVAKIDADRQDESFYQVLQSHMKGHAVSCAYLVGNAFDGGWMKLSLAFLCRGRRAFMGKNLYAKGACYAALTAGEGLAWPYVYLGDNELKVNVNLKVKNLEKEEFFTLLSAGENVYVAEGQCEVILDESKEIAIWLKPSNSREAKVEKLILGDLPERENKTTRLHISAKPESDTQIRIVIKDMGFGEIVKSSGMIWESIMSV